MPSKPMTRKDVIDLAEAHLLKQGRFAFTKSKFSSRPICRYTGKTQCAIGGLPGVTEAIQGIKHRNKTASYLLQQCTKFRDLFVAGMDGFFLDRVQRALHDDFCQTINAKRRIDPTAIKQAAEHLRSQYI